MHAMRYPEIPPLHPRNLSFSDIAVPIDHLEPSTRVANWLKKRPRDGQKTN